MSGFAVADLRSIFMRVRYQFAILAACGIAFLQVAYETFRAGGIDSLPTGLAMLGVVTLLGTAALAMGIAAVRPDNGGWPYVGSGPWVTPLWSRVSIWIGLAAAYLFLVFGPPSGAFGLLGLRMLLFVLVVLVLGRVSQAGAGERHYDRAVAVGAIGVGLLHTIFTYVPLVSTFPLALGWSETSRYYYASLFLDQQVYGRDLAPSVLHPTRYLLQAVPFLIERSAIWVHRLWQVVLWLGLTAGSALILARRLFNHSGRGVFLLFAGWSTLFLFQGPILYHLLIPVLLVVGLTDIQRPWRTTVVVLAASLWAGVSRINWIPVPAMLAVAIHMLESPRSMQNPPGYMKWPVAWGGIGMLAGFAAQSAYVRYSGNAAYLFGSSLTSDLLWYRILPNRTFLPGMLLATALASVPVIWIFWDTRRDWGRFHWLRWASIGAMMAILGAGGLVVSLKIGGGSNLHNLDAYLVLILLVAGYLYAGKAVAPGGSTIDTPALSWSQVAASIAIPIAFALNAGGPLRWPAQETGQAIVADIARHIDSLEDPAPSVLFIGERHLLTFGRIEGIELIPDHEKVFLMEMAMSQNEEYLSRFHASLRSRGFDLIVSEPLRVQFQGRWHAFGEENDAWVREVSIPILCDYEVVYEAEAAPVQLLTPRAGEQACPEVE